MTQPAVPGEPTEAHANGGAAERALWERLNIDGAEHLLKAMFPAWYVTYDERRHLWRAMRKGGWAEYRGQHGQELPITLEADTARWLHSYLSSWEATWKAQQVRWAKSSVDLPGCSGER